MFILFSDPVSLKFLLQEVLTKLYFICNNKSMSMNEFSLKSISKQSNQQHSPYSFTLKRLGTSENHYLPVPNTHFMFGSSKFFVTYSVSLGLAPRSSAITMIIILTLQLLLKTMIEHIQKENKKNFQLIQVCLMYIMIT